jgi:hypothetical protein
MYLVRTSLAVMAPITDAALRAHLVLAAAPEDGLEHVYAEVGAREARLVLFVRQDSAVAAERTAVRLCQRTLAAGSCLAGWSLVDCSAASGAAVFPLYRGPGPDCWPAS